MSRAIARPGRSTLDRPGIPEGCMTEASLVQGTTCTGLASFARRLPKCGLRASSAYKPRTRLPLTQAAAGVDAKALGVRVIDIAVQMGPDLLGRIASSIDTGEIILPPIARVELDAAPPGARTSERWPRGRQDCRHPMRTGCPSRESASSEVVGGTEPVENFEAS